MLRYLTIKKFAEESGYSPEAVRSKIARGDWLQDRVWTKAPDGRILIDTQGYEQWVSGLQVSEWAIRGRLTAKEAATE